MLPSRSLRLLSLAALALLAGCGGGEPAPAEVVVSAGPEAASGPLQGPTDDGAFARLTAEDGLASSSVGDLVQDAFGFVWVATDAGLARWDGRRIVRFRAEPEVPGALPSSDVRRLTPSAEGGVWVGTGDAGVAYYDPQTGAFRHYAHDPDNEASLRSGAVTTLLADGEGGLWVGVVRGLDRITPGGVERIAEAPSAIEALHVDPQGTLWAGSDGLCKLEGGAFACVSLDDARNVGIPRVRTVTTIEDDTAGGLWVGTTQGLWHYAPASGAARLVELAPGATPPAGLPSYVSALDPEARSLIANAQFSIRALALEPGGALWVGVEGGPEAGAPAYRIPPGGQPTPVLAPPGTTTELGAGPVRVIRHDRQGVVWLGTDAGLVRYYPTPPRQTFEVYAGGPAGPSADGARVIATSGEALWIGSAGRLERIVPRAGGDPEAPEPTRFALGEPPALAPPTALLTDASGTVWAAHRGRLYRLAPGGAPEDVLDLTAWSLDRDAGETVGVGRARYAPVHLADAGDALWIGGGGGLLKVPKDSLRGSTQRVIFGSAAGTLPGRRVLALARQDGTLWIGTDGGLARLDEASGTVTRYRRDPADPASLTHNRVRVVRPAPDGSVWVGTEDGLDRLDPVGGAFRHFRAESGLLPGNDIRALELSADGTLWIATATGLGFLDPEAGEARRFGADRGIPTTEYHAGASAQGPDGRLYFGTTRGVVAFYPDVRQPRNPIPPQVALTRLLVNNEVVLPGADDRLAASITVADEIALDHDDDFVTFEVAALHFAYPEGNRFRYRMEGFHDDWRLGDANGRAVYTNLDPGTYTFRAEALSADGVPSEAAASVRVTVDPPWWQTWWAYGLYLLPVIGIAAGIIGYQRRQAEAREAALRAEAAEADVRLKEAELEKKAQVEEAYAQLAASHEELKATQAQLVHTEKMASLGQFTAGVAHEIQNPLNFVNNFSEMSVELADELEEILDEDPDRPTAATKAELEEILADLRLNAAKIHEHGGRATAIVTSMLEHTRRAGGERRPVELNEFVEEYLDIAADHAAPFGLQGLEVTSDFDPAAARVLLAPQQIGRVLTNAVDNALYALREQAQAAGEGYTPRLTLKTRRLGADEVAVTVRDNGAGMDAETQERMFEPFFTTKPTGQGSTGLGLSLAYDIVTGGHGGRFEVESAPGEGTALTFILPAGAEPPDEAD